MMLPCRATRWCMTTKLAVFLYFDAKYKPSNFPLFAVQIFKGYACLSYCLGYDPFYFIFKTLNQGKLYWHFVCRAFIPIKTALFIHSFKMLAVSQYWYFECNKIRFVYAALPGAALPAAATDVVSTAEFSIGIRKNYKAHNSSTFSPLMTLTVFFYLRINTM